MTEFQKPVIKGDTADEKIASIRRYLFSLVDNLNWSSSITANRISKTEISLTANNLSEKKNISVFGENADVFFDRTLNTTTVILNHTFENDVSYESGTISIEIPKGFYPCEKCLGSLYPVFIYDEAGRYSFGNAKLEEKTVKLQYELFSDIEAGTTVSAQFIWLN